MKCQDSTDQEQYQLHACQQIANPLERLRYQTHVTSDHFHRCAHSLA